MAAKKTWQKLENNPEVMNQLAATLGLSPALQFYDVYSLDEPELLAHIPRPALALLVTIPLTPAWDQSRQAEDAAGDAYAYAGSDASPRAAPIMWFKQTIGNACGSIGLLHSTVNGAAADWIQPGSDLAAIRRLAMPLGPAERAALLYDSVPFERAHKSVEEAGDSRPPAADPTTRGPSGMHFVSFVKGDDDGTLWELEGSRKGPLARGRLAAAEDVLSPRALDMGIKRIMKLNAEGGSESLLFSCLALARRQ